MQGLKKKNKIGKAVLYGLVFAGVLVFGILGKDRWYNIVISEIAVLYLMLLNDGMRMGYLLGAVYAAGYCAVSITEQLYATAAFHGLFLLPTVVYRLFAAAKDPIHEHIRRLTGKGWCLISLFCVIAAAALYFLLVLIRDAQPLLEAVVLTMSLATNYLMLRNNLEMWYFNLACSLLYVVIWTVQFIQMGTGLSYVGLQAIASFINLRGIAIWIRNSRRGRSASEIPSPGPCPETEGKT